MRHPATTSTLIDCTNTQHNTHRQQHCTIRQHQHTIQHPSTAHSTHRQHHCAIPIDDTPYLANLSGPSVSLARFRPNSSRRRAPCLLSSCGTCHCSQPLSLCLSQSVFLSTSLALSHVVCLSFLALCLSHCVCLTVSVSLSWTCQWVLVQTCRGVPCQSSGTCPLSASQTATRRSRELSLDMSSV